MSEIDPGIQRHVVIRSGMSFREASELAKEISQELNVFISVSRDWEPDTFFVSGYDTSKRTCMTELFGCKLVHYSKKGGSDRGSYSKSFDRIQDAVKYCSSWSGNNPDKDSSIQLYRKLIYGNCIFKKWMAKDLVESESEKIFSSWCSKKENDKAFVKLIDKYYQPLPPSIFPLPPSHPETIL